MSYHLPQSPPVWNRVAPWCNGSSVLGQRCRRWTKTEQSLLLEIYTHRFEKRLSIGCVYYNWNSTEFLLKYPCNFLNENGHRGRRQRQMWRPRIDKWRGFKTEVAARYLTPRHYAVLPCKAKRQYLLTLQVSRYCLLALQSSVILYCKANKQPIRGPGSHVADHGVCSDLATRAGPTLHQTTHGHVSGVWLSSPRTLTGGGGSSRTHTCTVWTHTPCNPACPGDTV